MEEILEKVEEEFGGKVKFVQVDADENMALAERYDVYSFPTIAVFRQGELVEGATGVVPEEILVKKLEAIAEK